MATTDWTGAANDGDFSNNANWSGSAPSAGDTARFLEGQKSVTTGLTTLAAANLAAIVVGPNYTGNIGSAAQSLQVGVTNALIEKTTGEVHLQAGSSDDLDNIYVQNGTAAKVYLKDNIGLLVVNAGTVEYVGASASKTITTAIVQAVGGAGILNVKPTAAISIGTLINIGGTVTLGEYNSSYITISTLIRSVAGVLTVAELSAMSGSLAVEGGTVAWGADEDPTAGAAVDVRGGVLTFAGDNRAKTLGDNINLYGNGQLILANGARNVTLSGGQINLYGSNSPKFDPGMGITAYSAA
jgi:hypothetical protein